MSTLSVLMESLGWVLAERLKQEGLEKWVQEKKGTTEDKMAGWHHRLNGHEFE